jgi:LuxR family maltose regulon positive regulatory protein
MSRNTPLVINSALCDPGQPQPIPLDSPAWLAWLAATEHRSFHFCHPAGEFTARKERKQRGTAYWVAYRQAHNTLFKRYLGKAEALTEVQLVTIATTLTQACAAPITQRDP